MGERRVSIVINMSEDRLRKLIREEVRLALGEERSMEITLGNPSTTQKRIEKLEREAKVGMSWDLLGTKEQEARILGYTLDELRGVIAFAISRGWEERGEDTLQKRIDLAQNFMDELCREGGEEEKGSDAQDPG